MALKYLLDTNILSATLRTKPSPRLQQRLNEQADVCATAAPIWFELWFGCLRMPDSARRDYLQRELLQMFHARIPILPYDEAAASTHAALTVNLMNRGRTPPLVDAQIAAIALSRRLTLVTDNIRDFRNFPGLTVENWLRPGSAR